MKPGELNVNGAERAASAALGGLLVRTGLRRRLSLSGAVAAASGGWLLYRGVTGHCPVYRRLDTGTTRELASRGVSIRRAITVRKPPDEVYERLRQFHRMPDLIDHLESVQGENGNSYRWRLREGQVTFDCITRLVDDRPGEGFSWETCEGSELRCDGDVSLEIAPGGRGTEIHVSLAVAPPGGRATSMLAPLMRRISQHQLGQELHRLKQLMETGEATTSAQRPTRQLRAAESLLADRVPHQTEAFR